jgi:hypothetical protein
MINTFLMIPIAALFLYSEKFMIKLGQPEIVAKYASEYTIWMIPGAWAIIQFDAAK